MSGVYCYHVGSTLLIARPLEELSRELLEEETRCPDASFLCGRFFFSFSVTSPAVLASKRAEKRKWDSRSINSKNEIRIMNELMIVANVAIIFGVIYKLFELFARRKERMMLIEKLENLSAENLPDKLSMLTSGSSSAGALRLGCLLLGVGLGLLVGYAIAYNAVPGYMQIGEAAWDMINAVSIIYGASTLLGGGLGLVVSYIIELKLQQKKR